MARPISPAGIDENGKAYKADTDDAAYATFELEGGVVAHINSSWAVRVRRDDLVTFQVDGTHGSAVCGLTKCWTQHRVNTPKPVWNPDQPQTDRFLQDLGRSAGNAGLRQWLQGAVGGLPVATSSTTRRGSSRLREGAKGVQLAELGHKSWTERRWVDVPRSPTRPLAEGGLTAMATTLRPP